MVRPGGGTITQYEYPLPSKYALALNETAPGLLRDAHAVIEWINRIPASAYQPKLVEQFTGSLLGVPMLRPPTARTPGRNEQCPCGSGLKFKRCCGSATERA